jgi:hypothetical protein
MKKQYIINSIVETVEKKQVSAPYFFNYNSEVALTAGALKTIIKGEYTLNPAFTIKEEVLKVDNEVVANDSIVPLNSAIQYTLTVIDPSIPVPPSATPSVSVTPTPTPSRTV